jgi:nucleotide-binding universal stress UspA family protein
LCGGELTAYYARRQVSPMAFVEVGSMSPIYGDEIEAVSQDVRLAQRMYDTAVELAPVKTYWQFEDRPLLDGLEYTARFADIVIAGQHNPDDPQCRSHRMVEHLVLGTGLPVLMLPAQGLPSAFPKRIAVAWDGSAPSTRALHDSLPLLQLADEVHLLSVDGSAHELGVLHDKFARHDVNFTTRILNGEGNEIDDCLLWEIQRLAADLVVSGAYGRSRLSERVLSGVTRTLLDVCAVPVLFSH